MIQEAEMELANRVVVITGAARGIGREMGRRFVKEGLAGLVVCDIDEGELEAVAKELGAVAVAADVSREEEVARLFGRTMGEFGRVDLVCSNAGVLVSGGLETADSEWERSWRVNTWAHVLVARHFVEVVRRQGEGYLLVTVSAAGLLTAPGAAAYAVTKHAALGLAEWLAVHHAAEGLKVSALCPQFVRTEMVLGAVGAYADWMVASATAPEEVAEVVVQGLKEEKFLILPHGEVSEYFRRKADDYDRWLRGMRRFLDKVRDKTAG
jgi:NAD(P)-dependent dehydrogenase (short-subunit alcohol dehydrogenase family)